jgi:Mg-chelatase subunit ChlD
METQTIYNLIILDESGSMQGIKQQVINGFNETVQTIKLAQKTHENQRHFVSLVTFNGEKTKTIYDKIKVEMVEELTDKTYQPNYSTPLYDAMGSSITLLKNAVNPNDKILVTVITDGEENASKEYTGEVIKRMVEQRKNDGWVFAYIGANHDVERFASRISITNTLTFAASDSGTRKMFDMERKARTNLFSKLAMGGEVAAEACKAQYFESEK